MRSLLSVFIVLYVGVIQAHERYADVLCQQAKYVCISVKAGDTWERLFPDEDSEDLIKRLNRMNTPLQAGMKIAIPKHIDQINRAALSPFPLQIMAPGEKIIYVNQRVLAWGAYNPEGELVWWGPISSGKSTCHSPAGCKTPTGFFRIVRKNDETCESTAFPAQADDMGGGAAMPYCMHFFMGYALHGSDELPGYRASHGCIRLFPEDAQWLNEEFVDLPGIGEKGTRVVVGEYGDSEDGN